MKQLCEWVLILMYIIFPQPAGRSLSRLGHNDPVVGPEVFFLPATLKRDEGMSMETISSFSLPPLSAIAGERPPSVAAFSPLKAFVR